MDVLSQRGRLKKLIIFTGSVAALVIIVAVSLFIVPSAHAGFVSGNPGTASGGGGGQYWTTKGHGWKLFNVTDKTGPSGGFYSGNWNNPGDANSVVSQCKAEGANKVWAYVVRDDSGKEKSFTYINTYRYQKEENKLSYTNNNGGASYFPNKGWWLDRPGAGGDPYMYNASGAYDGVKKYGGANGYGAADNVVKSVREMYEKMGGNRNVWGWEIGWFCYNDAPPWKIAVSTSASPDAVEVGQTVTWTHTISVTKETTTSDVTWKAMNTGDLGTGEVDSWTYKAGKTKNSPATQESTYVVQPADFGKLLCRYTYASPETDTGGEAKSSSACVTVVKRPKIQVYGSDLLVGGNVVTSLSTVGGKKYGSWAEYSVMAKGSITHMGSGAAYASGSTVSTCSLHLLTFSNVTSPAAQCNGSTKYGLYGNIPATGLTSIDRRYPVDSSTPKLAAATNLNDLQSWLTYTAGATTINLTSSKAIGKGKWVVINAPGATIRINQNISYTTETLASRAEIPQVVIIAKSIIIDDDVTNVDAWLIAKTNTGAGSVITCDAPGAEPKNLSAGVCNKKLTINGPISTNHLYLYRTHGAESGASATQAAEVFNLRADAYLWAYQQGGNSGRLQTVTTREVPVRF